MEVTSFCESGCSTRVYEEKFLMHCEFRDFEIGEAYQEIQDGNTYRTVRKLTFSPKSSNRCFIGQSANFPSYWCINIRNSEMHAAVGLMYQAMLRNRSENNLRSRNYALCKFRIKIVDKEGDLLYEKKWQSWENARKIYLGEEYTMPDFIHSEHLFDNQQLFMPDKTLRLVCEGILYSDLKQFPLTPNKPVEQTVSPMTLRLWKNDYMEFSDLEIISKDGESTRAHKLILSSAGPILGNLVRIANLKEGPDQATAKLYLDHLAESEVVKMLQFIYTGNVDQEWDNFDEVERLILLAESYELRGLKRLCVDMVGSSLTMFSFAETVKTFQLYFPNSDFPQVLNKFFLSNRDKLIQQEGFQNFASKNKEAFLDVVLFDGNRW